MTREKILEIQARADAATAGPCYVKRDETVPGFEESSRPRILTYDAPPGVFLMLPENAFKYQLAVISHSRGMEQADKNADFYANAHTDVPALCAALLEAQAKAACFDTLCELAAQSEVTIHQTPDYAYISNERGEQSDGPTLQEIIERRNRELSA